MNTVVSVLVLGGRGMIGAGVAAALAQAGVPVLKTSRNPGSPQVLKFEAATDSIDKLLENLKAGDFVFNAIGLIKQRINEDSIVDRRNAIAFNADFPHRLAIAAATKGIHVIQVATDCVYEGTRGSYTETSAHDATDVYGKTKSLGEVPAENVMHLRCSVIGPETTASLSLFEWVRNQPDDAKLTGFTDHLWNGLTSEAFGRIVAGIVACGHFHAGVQHLVTASAVNKGDLVRAIAARCGRNDIQVTNGISGKAVDRTLDTNNPDLNRSLWQAAGYAQIPSVEELVAEMPIS